jgi:thiol-disulfide isomerase/thioredoxin
VQSYSFFNYFCWYFSKKFIIAVKKFILLASLLIFSSFLLKAQRKGISQTLSEHYFYNINADSNSLSNIFGSYKDSLVYVDFWASWCRPCLDEIRYSKDLAERFKGQKIVFLYLSLDENDEAWRKAIQNQPFPTDARHFRQSIKSVQPLLAQLFIYNIPHYLVLGKNSNILNRDASPPSQKSTVKYLQKQLKNKN